MADRLITVDNPSLPIHPAESIHTTLKRLTLTTELGLPPTGLELALFKTRRSSAEHNPAQEFRLGLEIDHANGGFAYAEFSGDQQVGRQNIASEAAMVFFDHFTERWVIKPLNGKLQRSESSDSNYQLSAKPYDFPTGSNGEKLPLFAVVVISRVAGEGRIPSLTVYKSETFAVSDPYHQYLSRIEPKFVLPPRTDLVGEGRPAKMPIATHVQPKPALSPEANNGRSREPKEEIRRHTISAAVELLQNLGIKVEKVEDLLTIMPKGNTIELYLPKRSQFDRLFPSYETYAYHARLAKPDKSSLGKRRLTNGIVKFTTSYNALRKGEITIYEIPQPNPHEQTALATGRIETYHYFPDFHVVISAESPQQLLTILQTMASGTRQIK